MLVGLLQLVLALLVMVDRPDVELGCLQTRHRPNLSLQPLQPMPLLHKLRAQATLLCAAFYKPYYYEARCVCLVKGVLCCSMLNDA